MTPPETAVGRRLGQHFLNRDSILERIAGAACPQREPLVVEIGPGRGALTGKLAQRAERVVAIEIDRALIGVLERKFADLAGVELVHADVLETDLAQWGLAVVAGNLPYYISSPILRKLLRMGPALRRAVVLVQKEVALRLTAAPGSRAYGYLTVEVQVFSTPRCLFTVSPSAFRPPPKVDSALVELTPRQAPADAETFLEFAARVFRHKRKTLRNNLVGFYEAAALKSLDEGPLRGEQLSVDQLRAVWERLEVRR